MKKTPYLIPTVFLVFLLVVAAPLSASEGGEGHFNWNQLIAKTLNSVILFGALFFLLKKPLVDLLRNDGQHVIHSFDDRQKQIGSARDQVAQLQRRVEDLKKEISDMVRQAEAAGQKEKDNMLETARAEVERLHCFAAEEIQQRVDAAVRQLREEIADAAITQVRNELKDSLSPQDQDRIIDKNIELCGDILEH